MPNGSRSPCTTSVGTVTASSSSRRLRGGAPGRLEREGEAEHGDRADRLGGAAGDPGAQRPAPHDQRQPGELVVAQAPEDGGPGGVELAGRGGRAPPRDAVGLLDQGDRQALLARDVRRRDDVAGLHPPASRAVTEDERAPRRAGRAQMRPGRPVRGLDVDGARRHQLFVR
jgi:hypothetical protein